MVDPMAVLLGRDEVTSLLRSSIVCSPLARRVMKGLSISHLPSCATVKTAMESSSHFQDP